MKLFKRRSATAPDSIQLGQHMIPRHKLFEHVMVSGNPGSGKSTFVRQIARQAQAQGWPVIIIDIDGESTQEFYDENRGDVILNPLDKRCPFWSPWLELRPGCEPIDTRLWPPLSSAGEQLMTPQSIFSVTRARWCERCFKS